MFIGSDFVSLHLIRSTWRNGGEPEIQVPYFCGLTQQTVLGNDGGCLLQWKNSFTVLCTHKSTISWTVNYVQS